MSSKILPDHIQLALHDVLTPPRLGRGVFRVWQRNFLYFRYSWLVTAFWAIFEPVLYLLAIGIGIGQYVGRIQGITYYQWYFPGLLATTAMMVSFFETTYGSFTKLRHQKTFAAILLTPIDCDDIVMGDIFWAVTKAMIGVLGVTVVGLAFGIPLSSQLLPMFLVLMLVSFVFATLGMLFTSYASHYDSFIYAQSGFIMPMALFSGTYFPVAELPSKLRPIAYCLPLTQGVSAVRSLLMESVHEGSFTVEIAALIFIALIATNWSVARIRRQLLS